MIPQEVWQGWTEEVGRLVSGATVWQQRGLAVFSLGMAAAQRCGLARVATVVPGLATAPSTTRRFERLLANERLDVRRARGAIGAAVLEQARGQTVWLALDETPQGHTVDGPRLVMLALRLVYRERAIPLAWACYRPGEAPAPLPALVTTLVAEVAAWMPPRTRVVLMTDRGLSWPTSVGGSAGRSCSASSARPGYRPRTAAPRPSATWPHAPAPAGRATVASSRTPAGGTSTSLPSGDVATTSPGCSSPTCPRPGIAAPTIDTAWTRRRASGTTSPAASTGTTAGCAIPPTWSGSSSSSSSPSASCSLRAPSSSRTASAQSSNAPTDARSASSPLASAGSTTPAPTSSDSPLTSASPSPTHTNVSGSQPSRWGGGRGVGLPK